MGFAHLYKFCAALKEVGWPTDSNAGIAPDSYRRLKNNPLLMPCLEKGTLMFGNWFYQARLVSPGWQASSSWKIGFGRAEKGRGWNWGGCSV